MRWWESRVVSDKCVPSANGSRNGARSSSSWVRAPRIHNRIHLVTRLCVYVCVSGTTIMLFQPMESFFLSLCQNNMSLRLYILIKSSVFWCMKQTARTQTQRRRHIRLGGSRKTCGGQQRSNPGRETSKCGSARAERQKHPKQRSR